MQGTWALNLFDRLHVGHHVLIDRLSEMPNPVAVVIDGEMVGKDLELASIIQPAELRVAHLKDYLSLVELEDTIRVSKMSTFDELLSISGTATFLMFKGPCCIEIEEQGLNIRKQKLKVEDKIQLLNPVRASDGAKLSSARIRAGEIDCQGRRLKGTKEPPRKLDLKVRAGLKAPKGKVFETKDGPPELEIAKRLQKERPKKVIAVGDMTSATLISAGFTPDVCVVDGSTKRGPYEEKIHSEREYVIYNPAAVLYPEAWSTMDSALNDDKKSVISVDGEEDLMGFPAVLLAPEGSVMLYGQPDVGIVWVPVNRTNKSLAKEFLNRMPIIT